MTSAVYFIKNYIYCALPPRACAGRIGIIDHDVVELSNLQRQTLHAESRLGMSKAESAACALKQFRLSTDTCTPPSTFSYHLILSGTLTMLSVYLRTG